MDGQEQRDLFGEIVNTPIGENRKELIKRLEREVRAVQPNPHVRKFGKGPDGKKCQDCRLLVLMEYHNVNYYKCELKGFSNSASSDFRLRWDACKKFQEIGPATLKARLTRLQHTYEGEGEYKFSCIDGGHPGGTGYNDPACPRCVLELAARKEQEAEKA